MACSIVTAKKGGANGHVAFDKVFVDKADTQDIVFINAVEDKALVLRVGLISARTHGGEASFGVSLRKVFPDCAWLTTRFWLQS
ncbi:hypothetical protein FGB62_8g132 [Gracilaria domingensis]|nr:hypothetical protein FGB62_8g132 [Gracilaria domingensis]